MSKYAKFLVVLVGVALMLLDHFFGPNSFASQLVVYALTGLGVYTVPNATNYRQ